jgi:hypothetical protein
VIRFIGAIGEKACIGPDVSGRVYPIQRRVARDGPIRNHRIADRVRPECRIEARARVGL